jgi:electron transfer flavoprotein beta subunit
MNIVALFKLVPDLVEELNIDDSGVRLDQTWLRLVINEFDDHAIEQAIILKESTGADVTVIAPDIEGVDDVFFTAAAKRADRLIKLSGDFEEITNNHALARALTPVIKEQNPDLVLTGVQANDDLDGPIGPLLAAYLGMPYVGYVSGVAVENNQVIARKEYPAGLIGEMAVTLPAVLGIQAAENPPRYVAVSKVRQAMKTASIEEQPAIEVYLSGGPAVSRMYQPEIGERATMIEGDEEEIAVKLVEIIQELGLM